MSELKKSNIETVAILGLGLIGGTFAYALRDKNIASKIIGISVGRASEEKALELGIVDELLPLKEAVENADLIILAVPVNTCVEMLPKILDLIDDQIVIDMGSTKEALINAVTHHPKRKRYLPTHPMWGTEFSGPEAALHNVLQEKNFIICSKEDSDSDVVEEVENVIKKLGMHIVYMNGMSHDVHLAYVSHISHITSFALANTVLEKEKEEDNIFDLASSGFESTVRLAKSNPKTWVPIFMQNKENVLDVLNEHISQLRKFKSAFEKENWNFLEELIDNSNKIKKILDR